jgi:hypothetical protein
LFASVRKIPGSGALNKGKILKISMDRAVVFSVRWDAFSSWNYGIPVFDSLELLNWYLRDSVDLRSAPPLVHVFKATLEMITYQLFTGVWRMFFHRIMLIMADFLSQIYASRERSRSHILDMVGFRGENTVVFTHEVELNVEGNIRIEEEIIGLIKNSPFNNWKWRGTKLRKFMTGKLHSNNLILEKRMERNLRLLTVRTPSDTRLRAGYDFLVNPSISTLTHVINGYTDLSLRMKKYINPILTYLYHMAGLYWTTANTRSSGRVMDISSIELKEYKINLLEDGKLIHRDVEEEWIATINTFAGKKKMFLSKELVPQVVSSTFYHLARNITYYNGKEFVHLE